MKRVQEWINTDMDFTRSCIFIDESGFDIDMKHSKLWSTEDIEAIIATVSTRARSHTAIGAIPAISVVMYNTPIPSSSEVNRTVGEDAKTTCVYIPP